MLRLSNIRISISHSEKDLHHLILETLELKPSELLKHSIVKRSHDARNKRKIVFIYTLDIDVTHEEELLSKNLQNQNLKKTPEAKYNFVAQSSKGTQEKIVVVGSGPCGLFSALLLAQMGLKTIVLERGKKVRERSLETFSFWKNRNFNPESNVQFGEGGAGTFSDGKLYTQIKDPMLRGRKVLEEFVKAGAPEDILYLSKPHIGTYKLVRIVEKIRAEIESLGGEFHFQSRVDELKVENKKVSGVVLENGQVIHSQHVILALGHSARDTFKMLHKKGVYMEAKPFSLGLRIEHPQHLIDECQIGSSSKVLGAADYKLVHHCKNGRSVYTFCMCPGGVVVASMSEKNTIVTNGMSQYGRGDRNANSGIVVGITPEDFPGGPLAGIDFQRKWEEKAFELGGGNYNAPVQLLGDFLEGKASSELGSVIPSYKPGFTLTDLSSSLPSYVIQAIREAIPAFDKKIKGFNLKDALLTGVETRTSSPLRMKRGEDMQSINTEGLYPAGEGAGYSGGILSSAMDGLKVAEAIALKICGHTP